MRPHTCNESVFNLSLCSSDERSTSLYISVASTNSSEDGKGNGHHQWHSTCPSHVELMRRAIQTTPVHKATLYISPHWDSLQQKHLGRKSVGRHKDEIMACVLFELIPMGNWEQREHKYRSGVLYLWWCEFQPGHWAHTPIVCELLHTPLDISSAGTSGAPPSSWCWGGDRQTQLTNPQTQIAQNGSALNKHNCTLYKWQKDCCGLLPLRMLWNYLV